MDEATTTALEASKKKAKEAQKRIDSFKKKHSPWVYELSSWSYDKLTKRRSDVIESDSEEKEEAE